MPTIAKHNEVITVIILFAVEPEQQQELINTIVEFIEAEVKHQPGFVSSSLHKSLDGVRVLNYAQWKTLEDYKAFLNNAEVQSRGRAKLSNFHLLDSHVYEVTISLPESADLQISPGRLIHLGEFRMKPENQSRLIQLEREKVTIALEHPDLYFVERSRSLLITVR